MRLWVRVPRGANVCFCLLDGRSLVLRNGTFFLGLMTSGRRIRDICFGIVAYRGGRAFGLPS